MSVREETKKDLWLIDLPVSNDRMRERMAALEIDMICEELVPLKAVKMKSL
ncbi:MAG: hypothetical protein ACRBDL_07610 [Alphaproteobacteria bacterium]